VRITRDSNPFSWLLLFGFALRGSFLWVHVACATQDIGTGTYTILAQLASQKTGVPLGKIDVELGNSRFQMSRISGGSLATSSVIPPVFKAADQAIASAAAVHHAPGVYVRELPVKIEDLIELIGIVVLGLILIPQFQARLRRRLMMATSLTPVTPAGHAQAANGLAVVRFTIGAMFVWVFFENLGKGLYTTAGYSNLINYYVKMSHSPAAWKAVMGLAARHAALAAPMQAMTEISLGILLVLGLFTRPAAFVAFLYLGSLWISEWGTSWIWELLVPVLASLGLALGRAGRAWGIDTQLAQRNPSSPWW
jgi:uncharacterized membrane protein YphA (DoxX/SURF4 family)